MRVPSRLTFWQINDKSSTAVGNANKRLQRENSTGRCGFGVDFNLLAEKQSINPILMLCCLPLVSDVTSCSPTYLPAVSCLGLFGRPRRNRNRPLESKHHTKRTRTHSLQINDHFWQMFDIEANNQQRRARFTINQCSPLKLILSRCFPIILAPHQATNKHTWIVNCSN